MARQFLFAAVIFAVTLSHRVPPAALTMQSRIDRQSAREESPADTWYGTCVRESRAAEELRDDIGSNRLSETQSIIAESTRHCVPGTGALLEMIAAFPARSPFSLHVKSQV